MSKPPIKQAIAQVMGSEVCNADTITARLEEKGWLPAAHDPRTYVAYLISASKDMFTRCPKSGRGFYRVNPGALKNEEPPTSWERLLEENGL